MKLLWLVPGAVSLAYCALQHLWGTLGAVGVVYLLQVRLELLRALSERRR